MSKAAVIGEAVDDLVSQQDAAWREPGVKGVSAGLKRTKSLKRHRSSRGEKGVRSMKDRGARGEERKGPVFERINSI